MIDFNYTAPELLPFRIQEVLDAPNEPHRIGGVVYVPEGGGTLTAERDEWKAKAEYQQEILDCDCRDIRDFQNEIDSLTAERDGLLEQRDHWFDEAVEIYRRFYPHDEYGIPQSIAGMVLAKIDELTAELYRERKSREHAYNKLNKMYAFDNKRVKRINELTAEVEKQRQRANDAERGVLLDEWYVARDRYEDDVAALTAERDRYEVLAVNAEQWKDERDQLSKDLTAEHALVAQFEHDNEQLREAIDAMNNGQFYSMYRAKCEECEQLKKVVRTQADSFKSLEIELSKARGEQ